MRKMTMQELHEELIRLEFVDAACGFLGA